MMKTTNELRRRKDACPQELRRGGPLQKVGAYRMKKRIGVSCLLFLLIRWSIYQMTHRMIYHFSECNICMYNLIVLIGQLSMAQSMQYHIAQAFNDRTISIHRADNVQGGCFTRLFTG